MLKNPAVAKGEVWFVNLDFGTKNEQAGERPAIIIADVPEVAIALVLPLTSNLEKSALPHTCKLFPSKENGLREQSIALAFQLRAISKERLVRKLGVLSVKEMQAINGLCRKLLGFD